MVKTAPASKPESMSDKVDGAYKELKDSIQAGSIDHAMSDITKTYHDMNPKDWGKFHAELYKKMNATPDMLPELSILTVESSMAPHLDNGVINRNDLAAKIENVQEKNGVEQQLLQYFLDNEYDRAAGQSGGSNVSSDDLNKDFDGRVSTAAALTGLEKNGAAAYSRMADQWGEVTTDSIQNALDRDAKLAAGGAKPLLDPQMTDLAHKIHDDDKLFAQLSHNGDRITLDDLNQLAQSENASVADLQKADPPANKPEAAVGKTPPATGAKPEDQGKPAQGQGGGDGQQQPGNGNDTQHGNNGDANGQGHGTKAGGGTDGGEAGKAHHKQVDKTYTVRSGDNLWQIARQRLIEDNHSRPTNASIQSMINEIAKKNGITNPDLIRDGQTLQI
jgi:LysM repeat protein